MQRDGRKAGAVVEHIFPYTCHRSRDIDGRKAGAAVERVVANAFQPVGQRDGRKLVPDERPLPQGGDGVGRAVGVCDGAGEVQLRDIAWKLLANGQRSAAGRNGLQGEVVAQPCKGLGLCVIKPFSPRCGLCHGKRIAQIHAGESLSTILHSHPNITTARRARLTCLLAQPFSCRDCKRHCARCTRLQGRITAVARRKPVRSSRIPHLNRHVAGVFHRHRLRVLRRGVTIGHLAKIQRGRAIVPGRGRGQQGAVFPRHLNLRLLRKITHRNSAQHGARIGVFHRDGAAVIARRQACLRNKIQPQASCVLIVLWGRQHGRGGARAGPKLIRKAFSHSLVQLHFQAQRDVAIVLDHNTLFLWGLALLPIAEVQPACGKCHIPVCRSHLHLHGQRAGGCAAVRRFALDDNILLIRAGCKVRFWGDREGKRFPAFKLLPFIDPADGAVLCLGRVQRHGGTARVRKSELLGFRVLFALRRIEHGGYSRSNIKPVGGLLSYLKRHRAGNGGKVFRPHIQRGGSGTGGCTQARVHLHGEGGLSPHFKVLRQAGRIQRETCRIRARKAGRKARDGHAADVGEGDGTNRFVFGIAVFQLDIQRTRRKLGRSRAALDAELVQAAGRGGARVAARAHQLHIIGAQGRWRAGKGRKAVPAACFYKIAQGIICAFGKRFAAQRGCKPQLHGLAGVFHRFGRLDLGQCNGACRFDGKREIIRGGYFILINRGFTPRQYGNNGVSARGRRRAGKLFKIFRVVRHAAPGIGDLPKSDVIIRAFAKHRAPLPR